MSFNGGKQYHIFKIKNNIYIDVFSSDESQEAFKNGTFYTKLDGANGYHLNGVLYERYDDRKCNFDPDNLPEEMMNIPRGENVSIYEGHHYYYSKLDQMKANKRMKKVYDKLYSQIEGMKNGSVEFVGPNFQMTPKYTKNTVVSHQTLSFDFPRQNRSFKNIKDYLLIGYEEGIVIEYKGKYWKIRANVYDKKCRFEMFKRSWINWKKGKGVTEDEKKLIEKLTHPK